MQNQKILAGGVLVVIFIAVGVFVFLGMREEPVAEVVTPVETPEVVTPPVITRPERSVIGSSVEGRPIEAYRYSWRV